MFKRRQKNIYLRVKDGRVIISAPKGTPVDFLKSFAESKRTFIQENIKRFDSKKKSEYITGAKHRLWGREYILLVKESKKAFCEIEGDNIVIYAPFGLEQDQIKNILIEFYRKELNRAYPAVLKECEALSGITAQECRIKNMKTRWGSCNTNKKRIWLSLRLACFDPICLRSVILHELCHIRIPNHSKDFYILLNSLDKHQKETKEMLKTYESTY
ncbi:MAG: SprT family zinc-dependent metalloprotease [Eubacteriales bacterium]|nr:SprT family zinc-dependent metalloprotease [Eubacteriales bacterium]